MSSRSFLLVCGKPDTDVLEIKGLFINNLPNNGGFPSRVSSLGFLGSLPKGQK